MYSESSEESKLMKNICKKFAALLMIISYTIPTSFNIMAISETQPNCNSVSCANHSTKIKMDKKTGLGVGASIGAFLVIAAGSNEIFGKYNLHNWIKNRKKTINNKISSNDPDWVQIPGKTIGIGTQGSVEKINWNGHTYARKIIDKRKAHHHNPIISEHLAYLKLQNIDCNYIVKPYAFYAVDDNNKEVKNINSATKAYVLYECVESTKKATHLTPKGRVIAALQLIESWEKLSSLGLSHGDLLSSNVMITGTPDNPTIKVCDFGFLHTKKEKYGEDDLKDMICAGTDLAHLILGLKWILFGIKGLNINDVISEISGSSLGKDNPQIITICQKLFNNKQVLEHDVRTHPDNKAWLLAIDNGFSANVVHAIKEYLLKKLNSY